MQLRKTNTAVEEEDTFDLLTQMRDNINEEIADRIRSLDINTLTPIEAIGILYEMKKTLEL